MSCTFVRSGKRGWFSTSGPSLRTPPRSGSRSMTACGFPTETGVNSRPSPPDVQALDRCRPRPAPSPFRPPCPRACLRRLRAARRDPDFDGPGAPGEPARGDPGPVPGELCGRAVGVPMTISAGRPPRRRPRGCRPSRRRSGSRTACGRAPGPAARPGPLARRADSRFRGHAISRTGSGARSQTNPRQRERARSRAGPLCFRSAWTFGVRAEGVKRRARSDRPYLV